MTLLYFALDNYFFILQVFFNFDLLCRSVICIFVCNLITYWQSFWKKRNIFMVSIDCVCFICPYIWSQTFEIGICFNIYIYIYIYIIYIFISLLCPMVPIRSNSIVICSSEFHALAIARHTSCLFYLKG